MSVKIVKLTAPNVQALTEMIEVTKTTKVTLTKTTATFDVLTAVQALDIVTEFQREAVARFGATGHPNAFLHAVRRKVEALAAAEVEAEEFTRAESAKVEAIRDAGTLADGLAAAKARSEARAESDAATDPLMVLLNNTEPKATGGHPVTRPAAGVDDASRERVFRARPGRHVAGRLLAKSKCGRRRSRR